MTDDIDEVSRFFGRRTDKTIVSKRFTDNLTGRSLRIATHVVDGQPGLAFAKVKDEVVLRQTPGGRYEIKASFFEDDRSIQTLTIQQFSQTGARQYFSFRPREINILRTFIAGIGSMPLEEAGKVHLSDESLRDLVLDRSQARRIFAKNIELFQQLAENEDAARDLIALGYRRRQLQRFERLLSDVDYFESERRQLSCRPEDVWQKFFEANHWIFGYGLSYQFSSSLDGRKLEQTVQGHDLTGPGKRVDAVMRTRGLVGSLCFVEIKRHDTRLLDKQIRSGVWAPHEDLTSGVSQIQATVHAAVKEIGEKLQLQDQDGDPTGDVLNVEPRSCLVIGSLGEFRSTNGVNLPKFRSFELYRRNTWRPEIITFDELLERARYIVEQATPAA